MECNEGKVANNCCELASSGWYGQLAQVFRTLLPLVLLGGDWVIFLLSIWKLWEPWKEFVGSLLLGAVWSNYQDDCLTNGSESHRNFLSCDHLAPSGIAGGNIHSRPCENLGVSQCTWVLLGKYRSGSTPKLIQCASVLVDIGTSPL